MTRPKPSNAAAKQKAYRARAKAGIVMVRLPVRREIVDRLAASGLTTAEECATLFEWAARDQMQRFRYR